MYRVGVFNDTSINQHYGCHAVMSVLDRELRLSGLVPVFYWPVAQDWRPFEQQIRDSHIDAIIVNGEGSIHNSAENQRARFLSELGTFAREKLQIPAILLNSTIHAIDDRTLPCVANFDLIYVRESGSKRYLDSKGIKSSVVPDLSFFSAPRQGEELAKKHNGDVIVTDSVLKSVAMSLSSFSTRSGYRFVPMTVNKKIPELYTRAWRKLIRKCRSLLTLSQESPMASSIERTECFEEFIADLRKAKGIFTGRFHAATLSLAQHVPLLAIESNTPKLSSMLRDALGSDARMVEISVNASALTVPPLTPDETKSLNAYLISGDKAKTEMFHKIATRISCAEVCK